MQFNREKQVGLLVKAGSWSPKRTACSQETWRRPEPSRHPAVAGSEDGFFDAAAGMAVDESRKALDSEGESYGTDGEA